ncbi:purine-nucleoside phosphorylase [Arcanobacterium wilhelmae]|uniref:purine-nucleoside phosphorylase n=1 Tax=Arcanobacterium wilhelmae TaxID=1803177 RepID=A0ABT9N9N4_9ACTO|nr:purine-nucleoside phosphorylase [Arcanobacterium wilhelmae]MDP9800419.1 purine-nucleoside phosphorylase [Arcanobacterium wilhelmae]WFN89845.1 purine-nucleoside phosphorylase [Arcanobacterium wilhelmae]
MTPDSFAQVLIDDADRAGGEILASFAGEIDALVVLGSGLSVAADLWEAVGSGRLSDLPGVSAPVADGHVDEFRIVEFPRADGGVTRAVVALGRTHAYEGAPASSVTAMVRAVWAAGARTAVLCNANGCLREWALGDVMAIEDHVNFSGISPFEGTFFLDTSALWDPELTERIAGVCERRGTYAFLRGPEYQTRAETRLLEAAGVDAVGMSTVLEALMAHALGMRVCGMSAVADLSFAPAPTDPQAVVEAGASAAATVARGVQAVVC